MPPPDPLSPAELEKLRLPNGKRLPPSLARWLRYDASWLGLFRDREKLEWNALRLRAFFRRYAESLGLDPAAGDSLVRGLPKGLTPETWVLVMPPSATQDHLLVLAKRRADGEYPMFVRDKEVLEESQESFAELVAASIRPDA